MSSASVIPSAPEYSHSEKLYPTLPTLPASTADDFRLNKISDLQRELETEADHYRQVAKKYNKAHSITHGSAIGLGSATAILSSAGIATALTGIGIIASAPIAGVAALTGITSTVLTTVSKKLQTKVTKHEKIYTLAVAKQNSVSELTSKALTDKRISDIEFSIILREIQKYHSLKATIRSGDKTKSQSVHSLSDLEKIRKVIRNEEREKLQKKIQDLSAVSKSNLKD